MKALIIVDLQNDFLPGGPLAVPEGRSIVPVVNELQKNYDVIAATQDWHPANHISFASNHTDAEPFQKVEIGGASQTVWPDHCIQGTKGADFDSELNMDPASAIFRKGMHQNVDSYSGFFDQEEHSTGLGAWLTGRGIEEVHVVGIAAEVCVANTAFDASDLGFKTVLIEDATKALDKTAFLIATETLKKKGVEFRNSSDII